LSDRHAAHGVAARSAKNNVPVPPSEMPVTYTRDSSTLYFRFTASSRLAMLST
jgi:hypothetical protein